MDKEKDEKNVNVICCGEENSPECSQKHKTTHMEQLPYLKKIEGQIRGIQKMIENGRYCMDVLIQINAVIGALNRVRKDIFIKHLENCVVEALESGSREVKTRKIDEIKTFLSALVK